MPLGKRFLWERLRRRGGSRMATLDFPPEGAAPREPGSMGEAREADFKAALLREQYRTLARLGPYVHGVVILATVALCATTQRTSYAPRRDDCSRGAARPFAVSAHLLAQGPRTRGAREARGHPARGPRGKRSQAGAGVYALPDGGGFRAPRRRSPIVVGARRGVGRRRRVRILSQCAGGARRALSSSPRPRRSSSRS